MRATVMYGAHDVRVETVPDARLVEPTDALVRVTRACICGSDLWPYNSMPQSPTGNRMGHEFIGIIESVGADVRTVKKDDLVVAPFVMPALTDAKKQYLYKAIADRVSPRGGVLVVDRIDQGHSALLHQLVWLKHAGFADVDCRWLVGGVAVFGGFRPLRAASAADFADGAPSPTTH